MKVILLDSVENLGDVGDLVTVRPGYGRNYLLPVGKAALATPENVAAFESRRADLVRAAAEELASAKARADLIRGMQLVVRANVGPEGKLFGSVGPVDIAGAFQEVGVEVARSEIRLPEGPIHDTGEFAIHVHLHTDVDVEVNLQVVPEA